jgi:putative hydrolase of the HAD superfamily
VIVDSSVEKCRKPDKEIYEIAQKRAGVEAEDILFIDNKQEKFSDTKELGWQTYWYDSSDYKKSNWKLARYLG